MPKIAGNGQSITITPFQLKMIKSRLPYKYQVVCDLMFYTGARVSECLAIRRCDVLCGAVVIRKENTKGKQETREIPIPEHLIAAIDKLPDENAYLFAGMGGNGHLSRYSFDKILRKTCKRLELDGFSSHGFRRTFITSLARNNHHSKVIMKCSGLKQLSSLEKYIDVTEEEKVAAVASLW